MKVDGDMFLTLSLIIDRYRESMFTGTYYLSPTTKSVYISERLAKMLKKEKVTGIEILESSDFQEIE